MAISFWSLSPRPSSNDEPYSHRDMPGLALGLWRGWRQRKPEFDELGTFLQAVGPHG